MSGTTPATSTSTPSAPCGSATSATPAPRWSRPSRTRRRPSTPSTASARSPTSPPRSWPSALRRWLRSTIPASSSPARVPRRSTAPSSWRGCRTSGRGDTERRLIVSRERGYHGVTYGGLSAQGLAANKEGFGPFVDEVIQVPADDIEALATLFATRGEEIAAFVTEPVQGAGGVFPPPEGYLVHARRLCDDHGAYLIADEVICAFGRLGHWFGSEHYDVRPDLATFAKGVSSGYVPLGGVVLSDPRVRPPGGRPRGGAPSRPHLLGPRHCRRRRPGLHAGDRGRRTARPGDGHRPSDCGTGLAALGRRRDPTPDVRGEPAPSGRSRPGTARPSTSGTEAMAAGVIVRPLGDCVAVCPAVGDLRRRRGTASSTSSPRSDPDGVTGAAVRSPAFQVRPLPSNRASTDAGPVLAGADGGHRGRRTGEAIPRPAG